jgi:hypothetical protein
MLAISLVLNFGGKIALGGEGNLQPLKQQTKSKYQTIINKPGLLTMLYMGSEKEWLVTVMRAPQKNQLPIYRMSFYRRIKEDIFQQLFEYETINIFQTAYTTIEKDRLMTIWTTGSAHRIKIFWVRQNIIIEVLSAGWKTDPEFVHLTNDNELEIVIPVEDFSQQEPKFAEVYQWTGKGYVLVHKLPWEERFKSTAGLRQNSK